MGEKILLLRSLPFSRDIRVKKEAVSLSTHYDVHVLIWDRDGSLVNKDYLPFHIKRFPLKTSKKFLTFIYMPFWWVYIIIILLTGKWDYVHAADLDTFFPAILVCKIKRIPIIYDIIDFYADTVFSSWPVMYTFVSRIDKILMRFTDVIILPDKSRREQIGLFNTGNIHFISNSPDERNYKSIIGFPETAIKENNTKRLKIFFGGGIDSTRGIDYILSVVSKNKSLFIKIMGPASSQYKDKLYNIYGNYENIFLKLEAVPHETIIQETINADVTVALYDPYKVINNRYASPNKLYEAMMCSKPIIVSDDTSMANIVRKENCGVVVKYGDEKELIKVLEKLRKNPQLRKRLGNNGRKAYEKKYRWEIMEKRLLEIYKFFR